MAGRRGSGEQRGRLEAWRLCSVPLFPDPHREEDHGGCRAGTASLKSPTFWLGDPPGHVLPLLGSRVGVGGSGDAVYLALPAWRWTPPACLPAAPGWAVYSPSSSCIVFPVSARAWAPGSCSLRAASFVGRH